MRSRLLIIIAAIFLMVPAVSFSLDIDSAVNKYYDGLAEIIEDNTRKPNDCVTKVGLYLMDQMEVITEVKEARLKLYPVIRKKNKSDGLKSNESVKLRPVERETDGQLRFKEAIAKFQKANPGYVEDILDMNIHDILGQSF